MGKKCQAEWTIAKKNNIPTACIVNINNCPKRFMVEQLQATQPYLLSNQLIEYTPDFRELAIDKTSRWLRSLKEPKISLVPLPAEAAEEATQMNPTSDAE